MDLRTDPPYRQAVQKYQFLMNASNALDREGLHKALPIDHYSIGKTKDVAIGSVSSGCGVVVAFVSFCFDCCLSSFCSVTHDTSSVVLVRRYTHTYMCQFCLFQSLSHSR